jgi:hypothetical protein
MVMMKNEVVQTVVLGRNGRGNMINNRKAKRILTLMASVTGSTNRSQYITFDTLGIKSERCVPK